MTGPEQDIKRAGLEHIDRVIFTPMKVSSQARLSHTNNPLHPATLISGPALTRGKSMGWLEGTLGYSALGLTNTEPTTIGGISIINNVMTVGDSDQSSAKIRLQDVQLSGLTSLLGFLQLHRSTLELPLETARRLILLLNWYNNTSYNNTTAKWNKVITDAIQVLLKGEDPTWMIKRIGLTWEGKANRNLIHTISTAHNRPIAQIAPEHIPALCAVVAPEGTTHNAQQLIAPLKLDLPEVEIDVTREGDNLLVQSADEMWITSRSGCIHELLKRHFIHICYLLDLGELQQHSTRPNNIAMRRSRHEWTIPPSALTKLSEADIQTLIDDDDAPF